MGQAPTAVLPSLRVAEAWTGVAARRERIARELRALEDRSELAVAAALHHELGRIAERAGKLDEALGHFQTAHVHDPGAIATIWAIRRIHELGSRWQDVIETLKAELAAVTDPGAQSQVWTERGMLAWSRLGDVAEARRALEEAACLDPRAVRPCHRLEWLEASHGTPAARAERLAQLAERTPAEELASAYRVELAFEEWRKDGSDRQRATTIMQAALNGAAGPSAVLDAIEYFAEESGSPEVLLSALEERRALVEGASAVSRLEVQAILLWSAAVAAGPASNPMAALSKYREAIAMAPEPEMLPELIRRAAWAGAYGVAHTVAAALGPSSTAQSAAYAFLAGRPDVARAELAARIDASPDDWIVRLLRDETERIWGGWAAVALSLEARLARDPSAAVVVELAELEHDVLGRTDAAVERLERLLEDPGVAAAAREDALALFEQILERTRDVGRIEALWQRELARAESPPARVAAAPSPIVGPERSGLPAQVAGVRDYHAERLCDSAIRRGDLRRAAEALGPPSTPCKTVRLAMLLQDAGDAVAAIDAFETAHSAREGPADEELGLALRAGALALDRAQNPELAAIWYERAHAIAPACVEADLGLDTALCALARRADRARAMARTLEAAPRTESWIARALERAWLLRDDGRDSEALEELDAIEAVEADRPDVAVLRWLLLCDSRSWTALSGLVARLADREQGDLRSSFLLEAAETAELGAQDPARALELYLGAGNRIGPDAWRARAGVVRCAARLGTAGAVDKAVGLALETPCGFEPEDLDELAHLCGQVLADHPRSRDLATAALEATPEGESASIDCTLLGAIRAAERAGDPARGAEIALLIASRVDDVGVVTALRLQAARAFEVCGGGDPLAILQAALETSRDDPAVLHALARHSPRLDPALRGRIAELAAAEASGDPAERAAQLGLRAEALAEGGNLEGAWALLEEAYELGPSDLPCLLWAQDVAEQIGEPRRIVLATERLAAAFEDADHAADAWIEAGTLYSDSIRDPQNAIRCFLAADRCRPGDRAAFGALRALFVEAGRYNELARLLTHQIGLGESEETTVKLLWERALVEGWTGNIDGARRDLDAVLAARPDHPDALDWRAAIHARDRQDDAALETYERLLRVLERGGREAPGSSDLRFATTCIRIAEVGRRIGLDPSAILEVMGKLLERRPDCPVALRHAADQAIRLGQWDDAAAFLERLVPLCADGPRRARTEMELCRIHSGERYDQDAAGLAVRRALEADPLSLDAVVALVELSAWVVTPVELAQRLDVAIAARRVALEAGPGKRAPLLLAELSLLQGLRGREEQAELVGAAARLAGEDPERVARERVAPSLDRGRVKLEQIEVDLPADAPRPALPPPGELRADLLALLEPERTAADHRVEALWQLLAPAVVRRFADERIGAAWQQAAKRKARPDDPLLPVTAPIAGALAAGRLEIVRSDDVPGIALGRRTVTVLGDAGIELVVDSRIEVPPPPTVAYRLARAVATAALDAGTLELVRHDSLLAAFEAARDPGSLLVEKLGKKERARARDLLSEISAENVESWYLSRRLGLARLLMVLQPDMGSAAKELGADPISLDRLCSFVASAQFESLRSRVRRAH